MAGNNVTEVNDTNFESEVVQADLPVLVDFTATWCGPCRQISPIVDEFAGTYEGRAKVVKVDIDQSPETAKRFKIRGVPTLLVLKGGDVVAQQMGAASKPVLSSWFEKALG
jgi:thioredoxin 1